MKPPRGASAGLLDDVALELTGSTLSMSAQVDPDGSCSPDWTLGVLSGPGGHVCVEPDADGDGYPIFASFTCDPMSILLSRSVGCCTVTDYAEAAGTVTSRVAS